MSVLETRDPEIQAAIVSEEKRQRESIILIASENYTSLAVKEAQGSSFIEKYAEGYPGHRYYSGTENADIIEILAQDRLKKLFGAKHANVQPHSGVSANSAVYFAYLKPGDTVLGMRLDHGGHLSHGSPVSFTGQYYNFVSYGVREDTELIDYNELESLAKKHQPKIIVAGASAYPRKIDFEKFREIADSVGAILLADVAHYAGLIAAGVYPDPLPHAQIVTSTTQKTLRGPRGAFILTDEEHSKAIDKSVFPGSQGGPMMHTIAAKAVCFNEALQPDFIKYQEQVLTNSKAMAEELQNIGLRIISGGTDSHLFLVDVTSLNTTGREATQVLESVGISVNANTIPFDKLPPRLGSGIRVGSPAITTRGVQETDARIIAKMMGTVLKNMGNEEILATIRKNVLELTQLFPVPGIDS